MERGAVDSLKGHVVRSSPTQRRRVRDALCAAVLTTLVWSAISLAMPAGAFAAEEAPSIEPPLGIHATHVFLSGTLNPGKSGPAGTFESGPYEFVYRPTNTGKCEGAGEQAAPVPPAESLGGGKESVSVIVEGLTPSTEYAACLVTKNQAETETAHSSSITFTTATPPGTPSGEKATQVTATTAKLEGQLNPAALKQPNSYFIYRPESSGCTGEEAQRAAAVPAPSNPGEQLVAAVVTGLRPATTYSFCLVGETESEDETPGPSVTFVTPVAAPVVSVTNAQEVSASSATLSGLVTPGGLPTHYRFEYITQAAFEAKGWSGATAVPSIEPELPSATTPEAVTYPLMDLHAETEYRFRLTAKNEEGDAQTVSGDEGAFVTLASNTQLPDKRAYELVSAAAPEGEPYYPTLPEGEFGKVEAPTISVYPFQVQQPAVAGGSEGEAITYPGASSAEAGSGNVDRGLGNQWLSVRTSAGWAPKDISPPTSPGTHGSVPAPFAWFSADLSHSALQYFGPGTLAPGAPSPCRVLYGRDASGTYSLMSGAGITAEHCGSPLFAGESEPSTPSAPRVTLFQTEAALTPGAIEPAKLPAERFAHNEFGGFEVLEPCLVGCNLYERSGDTVRQVNINEEGNPTSSANFGGYPEGQSSQWPTFKDAISADGSRIFWTNTESSKPAQLYVLIDDEKEVKISKAESAEFWDASRDGRYAIYTEGGKLWRFDTDAMTAEELAGTGLEGEAPAVEGVLGMNQSGEDAKYVYFVASNKLAENTNSHGASAVAGEPNLYVYRGGTISFIATLEIGDDQLGAKIFAEEQAGDWVESPGQRTAQVSPDGQHLLFQSLKPLTGYSNFDASSSRNVPEVFLYGASSGSVVCVSCSPTNEPPDVPVGGEQTTNLPLNVSTQSRTTPRTWMASNGSRVFFDSRQKLAAADHNGTNDVYEWEAEGAGSCTTKVPARLTGGCIFLLSGGDKQDGAWLLETDSSGRDVFFEYRGQLGSASVSPDQNEIYDARVEGGFVSSTRGCGGSEGCSSGEGAPSGAPSGSPPTSSFTEGANYSPSESVPGITVKPKPLTAKQHLTKALKACHRFKSKKRRAACEREARKKYAPRRARKATAKGSSSR